jgi:hypothetical protein
MSFNNPSIINKYISKEDQQTELQCQQLNTIINNIKTLQEHTSNQTELEKLQRNLTNLETEKNKILLTIQQNKANNLLASILKNI